MKIKCCPLCGNTALRTFLEKVPLVQNPEGNWEIPEVSMDDLNDCMNGEIDVECMDPHCGPCTDEYGNSIALNHESKASDYWDEFVRVTGRATLKKDDADEATLDEFSTWCGHLVWEHWEGKLAEASEIDI